MPPQKKALGLKATRVIHHAGNMIGRSGATLDVTDTRAKKKVLRYTRKRGVQTNYERIRYNKRNRKGATDIFYSGPFNQAENLGDRTNLKFYARLNANDEQNRINQFAKKLAESRRPVKLDRTKRQQIQSAVKKPGGMRVIGKRKNITTGVKYDLPHAALVLEARRSQVVNQSTQAQAAAVSAAASSGGSAEVGGFAAPDFIDRTGAPRSADQINMAQLIARRHQRDYDAWAERSARDDAEREERDRNDPRLQRRQPRPKRQRAAAASSSGSASTRGAKKSKKTTSGGRRR